MFKRFTKYLFIYLARNMFSHINRAMYCRFCTNLGNQRLPYLLIILFIGICNLVFFRLYIKCNITDFESASIVKSSQAFLWGMQEGNNLGPSSHFDRMESVDAWIKFMSRDENLKMLKTKTLLVYQGGLDMWGVNNSTQSTKLCSDKCIYLNGGENDGDNLINNSDGVLLLRDWYYQSEVHVPVDKLKILSFLESPLAANAVFDQTNIILASYNRASDIVIPYGKWINHPVENSVNRSDKQIGNYAEGKSKFAAIFVSNCPVTNRRMDYVNELKKYVSIDVYGDCGDHHCPRTEEKECYAKLKKDYKFYLAFENANCRDYITEKFYVNSLGHNIVPVVLGAHRNDYKAMAPPHSYIHVEDFSSPESLSDYLKMLDKNDTLYNEYFAWKTQGEFFGQPSHAGTLCRMCAMLHYKEYTKDMPPSRVGQSRISFDHCLPPGEWYWNRNRSDFKNN